MRSPGYYSWAYPSSMVSPYYVWFYEMGYWEVDVLKYPDGEFHLIQYLNTPIIPSLTKWQVILGPMRKVDLSYGFCEKYIHRLDITKRVFWAEHEAKTQAVLDEQVADDRHAEDITSRATQAVMRNPGLVERIAKNGLKEMDLRYLAKRIPKTEITKPFKGVKVDVPSSSEPAK